jgi:hypothetical protein
MGLPIDFYDGRYDADLTPWIEYFVETMARAADELRVRAQQLHEATEPVGMPWESLSRRQQQVLTRMLLSSFEQRSALVELRPSDIKSWFEVSAITARAWLHEWADEGFLEPMETVYGQRIRRYRLGQEWYALIERSLEAAALAQQIR